MKKYKLIFTIPVKDANAVRIAIGRAGAGAYGHYSFCSFSTKGIGRFRPEAGARPAIGNVGDFAEVEEERVECQVEEGLIEDVLQALRDSHPYEEIAYDLIALENHKYES